MQKSGHNMINIIFMGLTAFFLLASTLCQAQKRLFELLPSSVTNLKFNNKLKDTKEHNVLIYSNYYGGAGVGVGDFNNDGLQDLFFAGNLVRDELYLNLGDFKFKNITSEARISDNGGWSSGVVVGDVNNDGWQDIYVTRELYDDNSELRRNKLFINNGDLTFSESAEDYRADHDGRTRHATFFDYDKDGWLDLLLLTQPPNPGSYSTMLGTNLELPEYAPVLLRNTGNGYFEDKSKGSGIDIPGFPNSVSANDFNNDGWVDLYIANDFQAPDKLYLNQGDGTFKNTIELDMGHITYFSMGVDAADINNDGFSDISVLDMAAEDNFRSKANMSGMDPSAFWKVVNQGGHYQYMYNSLQLNNGIVNKTDSSSQEISFSDIAQISGTSSTDWSWSNLIADLDNDGKKDIYITNGLLRDIRNTDADKKVSKYIQEVIYNHIRNNPSFENVSIWDILDLKKALDILPSVPISNYAYRNNSGINFTNVTSDWGLEEESFSNGSSLVDLNNDGALDLVVNNINKEAFIYRNNSREINNNNYLRVSLRDELPILGCKIKILNEQGEQWYEFTSVRGMYSTSEQIAHFGLGSNKEIDRLTVYWNDGKVSELKDIKSNQHIIIEKGKVGFSNQQFENSSQAFEKIEMETLGLKFKHQENECDDYIKQVLLPHKLSQLGPALAVADVNGDGLEDVFFGGAANQASQLYFQDSNGSFSRDGSDVWEREKIYETIDASFFDFDQDGDQDLYVVSGGNKYMPGSKVYQDRLYRNNGNGKFERYNKILPVFYESGSCVRPGDFDADGDLDLFVGGRHTPWNYPEPTTSRILMNENGSFRDITDEKSKALVNIGMVTDAIWTDFDMDGNLDLMLVGEWMPVTYLRNNGEFFYDATDEFGFGNTTGWWNSIEQGDIDQDGDLDFILGNLGLNFKYKASEKEPFEVHYKDFDDNGQKDIVLSYYNFGEKYPLRGKSCSSQQVPMLNDKFGSYELFASSDLYDIYGKDELRTALNYKAKTFANILIKNNGGGDFDIKELPEYAQISSINDLIIKDFNGDKRPDILGVGNNYHAEIETPRNDAGKGVFITSKINGYQALFPSQSGFFAPMDARKTALITINNSKLVIVMNNDQAPSLFKVQNMIHKKSN
ncbi:MAG: VCBS repeat-containing protein [Cyclobacteriaceae bacterium]